MVKLQVLAISLAGFTLSTLVGCNNADVTVTGLKSFGVAGKASGANPINGSSYGAAVGSTSGGYIMKVRTGSVQMDPNTPTSGGYHIVAKVVKW